MIRVRRTKPKGLIRRPRYEVELFDTNSGTTLWRSETTTPVTSIDQHLGVAEAWALVHAADNAWKRARRNGSACPNLPSEPEACAFTPTSGAPGGLLILPWRPLIYCHVIPDHVGTTGLRNDLFVEG